MDVLVIASRSLTEPEQDDLVERLLDDQTRRRSSGESLAAQMLRSLLTVAERLGGVPTVEEYRGERRVLAEEGVVVHSAHQLISFYGSWRQCKEAIQASQRWTARDIDVRFRRRRLGKVWRYSEATLRQTLAECVEAIGQVPMVSEFEWWRDRQLEVALAAGDDALHLPAPAAYRRRWGSWEAALLHFGYTPDAVAERLERIKSSRGRGNVDSAGVRPGSTAGHP